MDEKPSASGPRFEKDPFQPANVAVIRQTILSLPFKTGRNDFCIFQNQSHRLLYTVASTSVKKYRFVPSQSHPLLKLTCSLARGVKRSGMKPSPY